MEWDKVKTSKILREGMNMDDPPTDGLDGALSIGLHNLPVVKSYDLCITDSGYNNFQCSQNKTHWQESIAIEQLKTVRWLRIDNCPDCFGFGFYDKEIPVSAAKAHDDKQTSLVFRCKICGSDITGVPCKSTSSASYSIY